MNDEVTKGRFISEKVIMPLVLLGMTTIYSFTNTKAAQDQERLRFSKDLIKDISSDPADRKKAIALYSILKQVNPEAAKPLEELSAQITLDHVVDLVGQGRTQDAETFTKGLKQEAPELLVTNGAANPEAMVKKAGSISEAKAQAQIGWAQLEAGNIDGASQAFKKSEQAYPTFRQSFEISKYIDAHRASLSEGATKDVALKELVGRHAYSAPKALKAKVGLKD